MNIQRRLYVFYIDRFRQHAETTLLSAEHQNGVFGNMPHPNGEAYHCIATPYFNEDGTVTVVAVGGPTNDSQNRPLKPSICDCHVTISVAEYLVKWKQF